MPRERKWIRQRKKVASRGTRKNTPRFPSTIGNSQEHRREPILFLVLAVLGLLLPRLPRLAFAYRTGTARRSPLAPCPQSSTHQRYFSLASDVLYPLLYHCTSVPRACICVPLVSSLSRIHRLLYLTWPFCLPSLLVSRTTVLYPRSASRLCQPPSPA